METASEMSGPFDSLVKVLNVSSPPLLETPHSPSVGEDHESGEPQPHSTSTTNYGSLFFHCHDVSFSHPDLGSITPAFSHSQPCPTNSEFIAYPALEEGQQAAAKNIDYGYSTESWKACLFQEVPQDSLLDAELLVLTFCTGILDAVTFSSYHVFCSKQTGNTILIALNLFNAEATAADKLNTTLSFGLFVFSAVAFGWVGNLVGHKRRLWFLISNITSVTLIFAAAVLRRLEEDGVHMCTGPGVVGLLSAACGGQLQLALSTRTPELNTAMVTGAIANLARDRRLLSKKNHLRTRRFLYWFSIFAGALLGAVITKLADASSAIFMAAMVQIPIEILFLLDRGPPA